MQRSKQEKQEILIAKLRQLEIAKKTQAQKMQSSGYVESQHGILTKESRLINKGHYSKSSAQAELDFYRENYRRAKKEVGTKIVLVKRV